MRSLEVPLSAVPSPAVPRTEMYLCSGWWKQLLPQHPGKQLCAFGVPLALLGALLSKPKTPYTDSLVLPPSGPRGPLVLTF